VSTTSIVIHADCHLVQDGPNVAIVERVVTKSGKAAGEERWPVVGNYPSVEMACRALLGRHARLIVKSPAKVTIEEYLAEVKRAHAAMEAVVGSQVALMEAP
jgi:hypothetical protein